MNRALVVREYGPPSNLLLEEVAPHEPGEGQVRVSVRAAGLNFPDCLVIAGTYQDRREPPFVPGSECAGVVSAVGTGVTGLIVGDRVLAIPLSGAFADEVVVDAGVVFRIPDEMAFVDAAGFSIAFGTVAHALVDRGRLSPGETVLVNGAAGGIGLASVIMARGLGATVIASVGSPEKATTVREAGAHHVIDYRRQDVRSRVLEITGGRGADVVVDPVGGEAFDAAMRCIAWRGRALVIGFASGTIPTVSANRVLLKGCEVVGVWWGESMAREPARFRAGMEQLLDDVAHGAPYRLPTTAVPLEQAGAGLQSLLDRSAAGKIVLDLTL